MNHTYFILAGKIHYYLWKNSHGSSVYTSEKL